MLKIFVDFIFVLLIMEFGNYPCNRSFMMKILVHSDGTLHVSQDYQEKIKEMVSERLSRYDSRITSVSVHVKDKNGSKAGTQDKHCLVEVHLDSQSQPIASHHDSENFDKSVDLSLKKMKQILAEHFDKKRAVQKKNSLKRMNATM